LNVNGIDLDGLADDATSIQIPDPVPGRVVHIDADFLAYMMSAEKAEGDNKSFDDMKHNTQVFVQTIKGLAGATAVHLHLTPSTSNKGGRHEQAIQKQYQGNRIDKPKPRYLNILREYMSAAFPSTMHQDCEADDGMSSMQYAAIARGERNLSIIATKDKDLNQVPGLHVDWDTGVIVDADAFGSTYLYNRNGQQVLKGFGQKFFWAQMLMGDTADNTQGLPKLPGYVLNEIKPTKETVRAKAMITGEIPATERQLEKAQQTLAARKDGLCGPVITQALLEMIPNHKVAYATIKGLYRRVGETVGFKHWKTGEPVEWQKVFVSEAQLHWMRRVRHDPFDVARWWQEILA
jgi:hypothetical protein